MNSCNHHHLLLLPPTKNKLRCQRCHLTIKADDLGKSYCPECFEESGKKVFDFEEIIAVEKGKTKYRCEECGIIIESG